MKIPQEPRPRTRSVAYKELLLSKEIPEEDAADNFDPDFAPPPTALPDPDEYSDEEIPEDELRELQLESEATLDLDDLRRKLREAKLQ